MVKNVVIFFAGLTIGVLITAIVLDVINRSKHEKVYENKKEVTIDGVILPKGTLLSEKAQMAEGFNILQLEVRIPRGFIEDYFVVREKSKDDHLEYWINGTNDN